MSSRFPLVLGLTLLLSSSAAAQHGNAPSPAPQPSREVSQFDFLLGQWELIVRPKGPGGLAERIHGAPKLQGYWKASRAFDGFGIEDELRIVDQSANPRALAQSLRVYDPQARRWSVTTLDVYRARFASGDGLWQDGEMRLLFRGSDADGKTVLTRTRFYAITPTGFRMQQDRSLDEGKTWTEAMLSIEAKRATPPSH